MWALVRVVLFILLPLSAMLGSCSDDSVDQVNCAESDLAVEIAKLKYADCGRSNGEITVQASGGKAPYRYAIDQGILQSSAVFIDVRPGIHVFSVTDTNDCTNTVETFMANKEPFPVNSTVTPSGCNENQGSITVTPLGGVPPYKYQLGENNDNYQLTGTWQGLRSGKHSIWVEDVYKCFFGFDVFVPSGISYKGSVASIIESKCATASCHGGTQVPDFRTFSVIKANASKIKSATANLSMPPGDPLTSSEIQSISCWVDDGALNN
jgi:SprB repeat